MSCGWWACGWGFLAEREERRVGEWDCEFEVECERDEEARGWAWACWMAARVGAWKTRVR